MLLYMWQYNNENKVITNDNTQQLIEQSAQYDYDYQDLIIIERNKEISQIAKEFQDINELMQNLAILVADQGDCVDSIRYNISDSNSNVEQSKKSLDEAEESQKQNSKITFGILIATTISILTAGTIVIAIN